jgi:hypothetical protein
MMSDTVDLEPVAREQPSASRSMRAPSCRLSTFRRWVGHAQAGECFVYYRGRLATERFKGLSALSEADRRELGAVAGLALALAEQGHLHLLQRRHGAGDYSYLAVARARRRS